MIDSRAAVIIVTFNSAAYIQACLTALRDHSPKNCRIIVCDNASGDATTQIVKTFPEVTLIQNAANLGFAEANNIAAATVTSEFIVLLNPDTVVTEHWLERLLAPFHTHEDREKGRVGITTPKLLLLGSPTHINASGNDVHISGVTTCRGLDQPAGSPIYQRPAQVAAASGACLAIRRSLWERLGGFDATYFMYLEDTDLSLRAQLAGYSCAFEPTSIIYHDYRGAFSPTKIFYLERNRWQMLLKVFQVRTLCLMLPALLLAEVGALVHATGLGVPALRAKATTYWWLLRNTRRLLRSRRDTQSLRRVHDRALVRQMTWDLRTAQLTGSSAAMVMLALANPVFRLSWWLASR